MAGDERPDPVLAPKRFEDFLASHFERSPLHVARRDAAHFAGSISRADIERLLAEGDLRFPDAQLSRAGAPIDAGDYVDANDRLIASRIIEHHREGATIVLSQAQRRVNGLARLCREVQRRWRWSCQANVYLTPAGAQGFGPHYDAHDVFILQVEGEKRFRFHGGGVTLPFNDERFDASRHPAGQAGDSVLLTPGDTLYIPRGAMHDAIASDACASLHVTLGVFVTTAYELAVTALQQAAQSDPRWRRAVSLSQDAQAVHELLAQAVGAQDVDAACQRLADRVAVQALPPRLPLFPATLMASDSLQWRPDSVLDHAWGDDTLHLRCAGNVLTLQPPFLSAMRALMEGSPIVIAALPGLSGAESLALAERLRAIGAVQHLPAPTPDA